MKLVYTAFDRAGKSVTDSVEARDIAEATDILRRQGFYVTEVKEDTGNATQGGGGSAATRGPRFAVRFGGGRQMKNLAIFTRQLYVLLSTGTPMVEALVALERQTKDEQ